jgi:hypothetical protein
VYLVFPLHHQEQTTRQGMADEEKPVLSGGMIGVVEEARHGVREDRRRFLERNAVPSHVRGRLSFVPRERDSTEAMHDHAASMQNIATCCNAATPAALFNASAWSLRGS